MVVGDEQSPLAGWGCSVENGQCVLVVAPYFLRVPETQSWVDNVLKSYHRSYKRGDIAGIAVVFHTDGLGSTMGSLRIGSRCYHVPVDTASVVLLSPAVWKRGDGFEVLKVGWGHWPAGSVE